MQKDRKNAAQIQQQAQASIAVERNKKILDEKQQVSEDRRKMDMQERLELIKQGNVLNPTNLRQYSVILEEEGIKDVLCKSLGSPNHINVARATIDGLANLQRPDEVAKLRGLAAEEFVPTGMLEAYKESERTVRELEKS